MGSPVGLIGVVVLLAIAWTMSSDRRRMPWRIIVGGILLQLVLAFLLLRFHPVVLAFDALAAGVNQVISSADAGITFVFGELGNPGGPWGFVFAIRALSVVIFFASLMAVLYHLGIMQRLVAALAWLLRSTMGVTGTEALAMAANVFVGQTEAPLCVKPYIERMTRSQIMTLMVGGFATIAGSVLGVYVGILGGDSDASREEFIKHLLTASVMSAPAAFVIAKVIVPETDDPIDEGLRQAEMEEPHLNVLDAAAAGATDGMKLALNIAAMLIAFVAILALVNKPIAWLGLQLDADPTDGVGLQNLSLQLILGWIFTPIAWVMGVAWEDCGAFGSLLGQKLILTEFYAYKSLGDMIHAEDPALSHRSAAIAAYALCGFANVPSIAIQIGGLSAIAPGKRREFVTLGARAMIGGAIASWMTASIAGLFIP
ncbi:MAG: nucleoside transporter C-terminal domain-containing protein [Phycisphaerales bacterium]